MDFIVGFFVLKELEYSLGDEDYLRSEPSQMPGWNILFSMDNACKEKKIKLKRVFHFALPFATVVPTYIYLHTIYFTSLYYLPIL